MKDSASDKLLSILNTSSLALSTRDLGVRLRRSCFRIQDYEVGGILRDLMNEGKANFSKGRWAANPHHEGIPLSILTAMPSLSKETLDLLNWKSKEMVGTIFSTAISEIERDSAKDHTCVSTGKWDTFRRLVAYYRQCLRHEEGADASAFQNELGKRFLYLRQLGLWHPRPGVPWQSLIPLGSHIAPLLKSLPVGSEDYAMVLGYPVQAYFKEKEGEAGVAIIRPIFFYTVETTVQPDGLIVVCDDPRPEVNLGWLEFAFAHNLERQRNFLSACGFLNQGRPIDEPPLLERGERMPGLKNMVAALSAFMAERVREPLQTENVPDYPLSEPFQTGIYNRAVLMLAKRTKFTATLLRELAAIERAPDDVLDRTALRYVFTSDRLQRTVEELVHEAIVADTGSLNADQRIATASLLVRDVTVVTGPPGTGKSQVVSNTVANARLRNQTVLLASRNHKAIDAVIGRLSDSEGRPLIVRTNSKDDPNLSYTFSDAIREMLDAPPQPEIVEQFKQVREELLELLKERGKKAAVARRTAEVAMTLGELEERKSFIAKNLPQEMALFLETQPNQFPIKAMQKVIRVVQSLYVGSPEDNLSAKFRLLLNGCMIFPWYRVARRKLRRVPKISPLPAFPGPSALRGLIPKLSILEKALEYVRLRIECIPIEKKLTELPQAETVIAEVGNLSKRIEKVTLRAIILDTDSRSTLDGLVNREQLDGLRAALNAMHTGLDEGLPRQEIIRVLEERAVHILKAFPCWAVTSLSAGSRIPLIAGLFDLAIIDEASQSDIPSAIPILYRARRAGVVGDPFQLSHASRLTTARDTMLRRRVGLKQVEHVRFAYTESSLYDLFAGTNGVEPIFLSETFRSTEQIANYSSRTFYNGRLRVATEEQRLTVPRDMSLGIHWTEVKGEIRSGGGSGCTCHEEVCEVVRIMRTLLLENNFLGTAGVVTPFRQQANRLRDALFESDSRLYEALLRAKVHVDTAHGFQGDERDIILFSLCAGPGMPIGSLSFLRETGNLFNVTASRARAVLHVVGNREWAKKCGIRHIEALASTWEQRSCGMAQKGPWHPHESPWEEKLYRALVEAGLEPRPQFPVSGRRLDLALIRQGEKPLKIDIEVDGDCHRNPDGTRKMDDLWRDLQLQGMGWKVMRFWTYRLREDMRGCVKEIQKAWSEDE